MDRIFDISVRISRVGDRDSDRLYSDENQEEECRQFILGRKLGTVGVVTKELNVSGGKAAKDRALERLIRRVESGESNGIVVNDFSRLTREDAFTATMMVGRIQLAGGVVYGVVDNYDSSAPMAAVMTALYAEQAHAYYRTVRERSAAGQIKARERGAYTAKTPNGYERGPKGELIEGELSWLPQEIFNRKLAGESYAALRRYACENGLQCTVGAIRKMLSNPVYIGEGKMGPSPMLVDRETFFRVQAMTHKRKATGLGAKTLCQSLAVCANCGATLIVTRSRPASYYCRGNKLGGCTQRGCITVAALDAYVESQFLASIKGDGPLARAYADEMALTEAAKKRDETAFELEQIKESTSLVSTLGIKAFEEMVAEAKAKLDIAEAAYQITKANADAFGGLASMLKMWLNGEFELSEQRELLAAHIESIKVGKGRVPVEQKVRIIFKAGVLDAPDHRTGLSAIQNISKDPLKQ